MKRKSFLILTLVFLMLFSGCARMLVGLQNLNDSVISVTPEAEKTINTNSGEGEEVTGERNIELMNANKKFAWELFKKINDEDFDKEVFMSPLSVSSMLMMAYNGAEGTTKEAMAKAMHYEGMSVDGLNEGYKYLINRLNNIDEKVKMEIANSIWFREGFKIKQKFIDINRNFLSANVKSLNFSDPLSANEINNWVAKKTNNLIPSIISPPIAEDVMMYLINAIYFKGEWTEAFKSKNTFEADFHSYDGLTDKVKMMQRNGRIDLAESDDYRAVSLPYGDEKVSMMVILPKGDINEFIKSFEHKKWNTLLENLRPIRDLHLQLPKFKMEYGIKELNSSLSSLGMGEMFSKHADFNGISNDLFINKVLHKAIIDVNEEGTEAAAVTVGEMTTTAYVEPVKFIADRPFVFVIYDTEEGNILFAGKKLFGER